MDTNYNPKIEEIVGTILGGNCLLFLGSGFSKGATNLFDNAMPTGRELSDLLDLETNEDNDGDLEEAAENYIETFGEIVLAQKLRNLFTVKTTSDAQNTISRCKWRRIYTTNYDNVVESIMAKDKKQFLPVTLSSPADKYTNKRDIVVHLNGSIYNLSSDTLSSEFKLTSISYLTQQFQESSWRNLFAYDIKDSDLIVFVGFSLRYDLDIKKLLWEDSDTKKKCVFIMKDGEPQQNIKKACRYGSVFSIGVDTFAKVIDDVKRNHPPLVTRLQRPLLCFKTPAIHKETVAKIPDASIVDMFLYGKVNDLFLQRSYDHPDSLHYYINRTGIGGVLRSLNNGTKDILVHSDLGNGKSLFIKGLTYELLNNGYKVFVYDKYLANLHTEIEQICEAGDSFTVFVVENYNANRNIIEAIQTYRSKQRLIVSERSVTNDMYYDWIRGLVKRDFYEVDVNRLEDGELDECIAILDKFGLWRNFSNYREDQKKDYLIGDCKRSVRLMLLAVINSTDIRQRIEKEISTIRHDADIYQALVLMLVSNLLDWNISLDDISLALGDTIKGSASFRHNEVVKEYVDFNSSELKVKSSILSEVILTHIMDVNVVRETLVKAFRNFDNFSENAVYRKFMITILSYANLQKVFNKEEGDIFNDNIVTLFEDIRNCRFCTNNPHYWLQYAIAKLGEQKFEEAKLYFDNAYTFAKRRSGFDTYQIDNHFARYLLENAIYSDVEEEFMKVFWKAHYILTDRSHLKDTKYYPFKVARSYLPFYEKFKNRMSKKEKSQFGQACHQIDVMIENYKNAIPAYRTKHEVREAEKNIKQIIADMSAKKG